jgi:predicted permease
MSASLTALAPIFFLIALGYLLRRIGVPGDGFWTGAEKLTYYLLFPALLLHSLAAASLGGLAVLPAAAALTTGVVTIALIALAIRPWLHVDGPAFSSVFQGTIRFNTYVGIAAALALYGKPGLTLTAIAIGVLVPVVNVLSVAVLAHFAAERPQGVVRLIGAIAANPLIIACALGAGLNLGAIELPDLIADILRFLGRASLPIGLLAVGAGLSLKAARKAGPAVVVTSALKLIALPLVTLAACQLFGVSGLTAKVVLLFSALPISASAFVLASQMGGDKELMAAALTLTTVLAAVTLPLILALAPALLP